jgi:hypothetical protein
MLSQHSFITLALALAAATASVPAAQAQTTPAQTTPAQTTLAQNGIAPAAPESVWIEAEDLGPLHGGNFSFQHEAAQTKGTWALAGPGVAAEFMQGGESEFKSIAARVDEAAGVTASREVQIPVAGNYTLWVRYGDYRNRREEFGVRVRQGSRVQEHVFGRQAIADDMDPKILLFDWLFVWDSAPVSLAAGPATVEVFTTGPTEARRQVDCLCLTTDAGYHPVGRQKPAFTSWRPLHEMQQAGMPEVAPLAPSTLPATSPSAWRLTTAPPWFQWNVGTPWQSGLALPADQRVEAPYKVDSSMQKEFLAAYQGKQPEVYSSPLSGFTIPLSSYPAAFTTGSPVLGWLDRHPEARFSILMNYGKPTWPKEATNADKAAVYANLKKYQNRFIGFVAGENLENSIYVNTNGGRNPELAAKLQAAKSRAEVLAILREWYDKAVQTQMSDYYGTPVSAEEAWRFLIPCYSVHMESFAHSLFKWGVLRIGHESTADSPTLARRLAFMRGAARQYNRQFIDYQSCNFGDSSTIYVRNDLLYPASTRYVLDSNYDIWAGAGMNWVLKDYLLYGQGGAEAFYHEEGHDIFWKPAGGSAGDSFPVQLSPRGKVTERVQRLWQEHPRGTPYTPVAFLLDEAHGWSQAQFETGAFDLDATINPAVLSPNRHDASIRGWFDVAYYPAPETQSELAVSGRQTYVNGIFGDIFDVIVTAPQRTAIAATYPVIVAAGNAR